MSEAFFAYYWVTAAVTFWLGMKTPTSLSPADNLFAMSVLCLFGFLLWPLFLVAFFNTRR